jgi:tRNA1(Val) A37 N6-methylase TrmN6
MCRLPDTTEGWLLGGRVHHAQFRNGHRTGLEPVLLAAAVPAQPGERVLEGGTGSGAALLCLAARVPGLSAVGLERDPALATLARANAAANGFADLSVLATDITAPWPGDTPDARAFDHALANPPWHGSGTASPDAAREAAKRATPDVFAVWAARLASPLRPGGTLTLVASTGSLPACLDALRGAGCGSLALLPLWPRPEKPAKLVLLQGVKGGRGACRVLAGLVLHTGDGGFTPAANAVLRDGAALPL